MNKLYTLLFFILMYSSCSEKAAEKISSTPEPENKFEIMHPLDALNQNEIKKVIDILKKEGKYDSLTRLPELTLAEPSKEFVYNWKVGDPFSRSAKLILRQDNKTFEALINITKEKLEDWYEVKDVQPALMLEEWIAAASIWKKDKRVIEELGIRGYDLDKVFGAPLTGGYFGDYESRDKRLLKVWLLDISEVKYNNFAKPINGITPVVDLNLQEVVDVIITSDKSRNNKTYDYDEASTGAKSMKKVTMNSPDGNNFKIENGMISWDGWKFHFRQDKRFGTIISMASFDDQMVVYQLSANEMFVPYMDASEDWKYRSYMDIGEYGFGLLSSKLELGTDVPENATLLDAVMPMDNGMPSAFKNIIGVFERNTGRPLWRHADGLNKTHESRAEIELVVRTIPVVGNYDYVMDFVFSTKGILKVEVGATGMDAVKAATAQKMSDPSAQFETKAGNLVAPNLIGVNHDHYLSFRVDMDVDGRNNTMVTDEIVPVKYENNVRISGWEAVEHPELIEGVVSGSGNDHDGLWRVVNKTSKNSLGQYKGYQILGHTDLSQLDKEDYPQKRAAWSAEQLWVTPYSEEELYPSGKYPNQSEGKDGIMKWIAQERSVDNTDIVCWYTMGFHHITLPEDWPILPTVWHSFVLRPASSFERNPAVDIAK